MKNLSVKCRLEDTEEVLLRFAAPSRCKATECLNLALGTWSVDKDNFIWNCLPKKSGPICFHISAYLSEGRPFGLTPIIWNCQPKMSGTICFHNSVCAKTLRVNSKPSTNTFEGLCLHRNIPEVYPVLPEKIVVCVNLGNHEPSQEDSF